MNYNMECIGEKVEASINSEGCLDNEAKKSFKGTINFISGCKKAKGDELENCILLSNKAKSKSLPMLLCTEEDVEGSHGISTGKIDNNKLFYLLSKGLNESEAKKLIIYGNYNKIINNINNQNIKEEIIEHINNKLK